MGGGTYSTTARSARSEKLNYASTRADNLGDTFKQKALRMIHESLSPKGVAIRESRDSPEHPLSFAILLGIDFTGSMGSVPAFLVSKGLPHMIEKIFNAGIKDPQVGFIGIGDHECDNYPLQVGQFESSDEKLDMDLTNMYPEGGGGGNGGESYLLAWYHAAFHTDIDCFNKRGQKGLLITIGDEPNLNSVPGSAIAKLYGLQSAKNYSAAELLEEARKKYDVYHINVKSTHTGQSSATQNYWPQIMGENFIQAANADDIADIIAGLANKTFKGTRQQVQVNDSPVDNVVPGKKPSNIML